MRLDLHRLPTGPEATEGRLFIDQEPFCYTLEPKAPIPAGTYGLTLYNSPRFREFVPWLQGVPGHTFIEMHCGNSSKDTDGCILVALDGGASDDNWIGRSRPAFDALVAKMRAAEKLGPIILTIHDPAS